MSGVEAVDKTFPGELAVQMSTDEVERESSALAWWEELPLSLSLVGGLETEHINLFNPR